MNQNLNVNKTNFHMKGFVLGFALKQRRKATWKWAVASKFERTNNKPQYNTSLPWQRTNFLNSLPVSINV